MRNTLNNIFQLLIPEHPFIILDLAAMQGTSYGIKTGFSSCLGLTSGMVDLRFRYIQSLNYKDGLTRDIDFYNIEFTYNMPLQNQFLRTEPLIF